MPTLVLVEGVSDLVALETLARRRGRDLQAEGVSVVPIGGAHALGRFLVQMQPRLRDTRLAGLCDAGEEPAFRRGLERAGLGSDLDRAGLERLGFFVCTADLEDELIRALGPAAVARVIDLEGESQPWRSFQRQPAQRGRPAEQQLRRFLGTLAGRKARYARALVEALEPDRVPEPLDRLLAHV